MQIGDHGQGSGHYVTAQGAKAFVPAPLPPTIAWSRELVTALSDADRALGELAGLGRNLPNPRLLMRPFMNREAVLSSRIEGTETGLAELYAFNAGQLSLLEGGESQLAVSDAQEVSNYVRALEVGLERVTTLPVSLRLIRELHSHLMARVRGGLAAPGEFRRTQNWIGRPGCSIEEATFVPPPVPEMMAALHALESFMHAEDDIPPLVRVGLVHYQFECIHPFSDGNGRIGRLLIVLLLVHWNVLPLPLLYLSAYFERNRQQYYDLLRAVTEGGDWDEWLRFFLVGVAQESRDAINRARRLLDLQAEMRNKLTQARASALLPRLVDSLFETPYLTVSMAASFLGITYPAAQKNVQKLVDAGILTHVNPESGYGKVYLAMQIVDVAGGRE